MSGCPIAFPQVLGAASASNLARSEGLDLDETRPRAV